MRVDWNTFKLEKTHTCISKTDEKLWASIRGLYAKMSDLMALW